MLVKDTRISEIDDLRSRLLSDIDIARSACNTDLSVGIRDVYSFGTATLIERSWYIRSEPGRW